MLGARQSKTFKLSPMLMLVLLLYVYKHYLTVIISMCVSFNLIIFLKYVLI